VLDEAISLCWQGGHTLFAINARQKLCKYDLVKGDLKFLLLERDALPGFRSGIALKAHFEGLIAFTPTHITILSVSFNVH